MKKLVTIATVFFFLSTILFNAFASTEKNQTSSKTDFQALHDTLIDSIRNFEKMSEDEIATELNDSINMIARFEEEGKISTEEAAELKKNVEKMNSSADKKGAVLRDIRDAANKFQTLADPVGLTIFGVGLAIVGAGFISGMIATGVCPKIGNGRVKLGCLSFSAIIFIAGVGASIYFR